MAKLKKRIKLPSVCSRPYHDIAKYFHSYTMDELATFI